MDDATWQSQDIAPSGISIPPDAPALGALPSADADAPWSANGHAHDERDRRGRSRSRSPGPGRDSAGGGNNPGNNLHVSSLSHRLDTRDLEDAFAKVGRVKKASVMYDPHTRESRGFGFVTMETPEEAEAAIAALHGTDLGGKTIRVEKARRGRARTPTPGRYYGPPKRGDNERPYDPRPYDSRYARDGDRGDRGDRGGRGGGGRYDDRDYRGGRDDRDRDYRGGRDRDRDRDYDRGGRDYDRDERRGGRGGGGGGGGGYDERRY